MMKTLAEHLLNEESPTPKSGSDRAREARQMDLDSLSPQGPIPVSNPALHQAAMTLADWMYRNCIDAGQSYDEMYGPEISQILTALGLSDPTEGGEAEGV